LEDSNKFLPKPDSIHAVTFVDIPKSIEFQTKPLYHPPATNDDYTSRTGLSKPTSKIGTVFSKKSANKTQPKKIIQTYQSSLSSRIPAPVPTILSDGLVNTVSLTSQPVANYGGVIRALKELARKDLSSFGIVQLAQIEKIPDNSFRDQVHSQLKRNYTHKINFQNGYRPHKKFNGDKGGSRQNQSKNYP